MMFVITRTNVNDPADTFVVGYIESDNYDLADEWAERAENASRDRYNSMREWEAEHPRYELSEDEWWEAFYQAEDRVMNEIPSPDEDVEYTHNRYHYFANDLTRLC
jgi:hypothetical protein